MMAQMNQFFLGVVEDSADFLNLGRVRVRVVGLHSHLISDLPTYDLPWAMVMQPPGSGRSTAPSPGTTVIVIFNDFPHCQQPIVIGELPKIPQFKTVFVDEFEEQPQIVDNITPAGRNIPLNYEQAVNPPELDDE